MLEISAKSPFFFPDDRYVLPLDFDTDFGLDVIDIVTGIEIVFLTTGGNPDLAGAYIIGGTPIACDTIDLGNDTTVCNGQGLVLDATYPEATYLWQDASSGPSFHVTESGQYWVSVTTDCGVVTDTVNVTIADVYPSIIDAGGNVLECTDPFYTYQWYYNDVLIPGATDQSYTVSAIGTYYVEVSDTNECEGISNAIVVDVLTRLSELSPHYMTVYPNPNLGSFKLSTTVLPNHVWVYNSVGQMVLNRITIDKNDLIFNLSVAGVYFIHAQFDDGFAVRKLIVR